MSVGVWFCSCCFSVVEEKRKICICCIERLTTNVFCTLLSLSVVYPVGLGMNAWTRLLIIADDVEDWSCRGV